MTRTIRVKMNAAEHSLEWADTADIHIFPLDDFGRACIERAKFFDPDLWKEDARLHTHWPSTETDVFPANAVAESEPTEADRATANRQALTGFFEHKASPEGDHDHCILIGSLAEPESLQRALLFFETLLGVPRWMHLWRACGLWACSETTANDPTDEVDKRLNLAVERLRALHKLYQTGGGIEWRGRAPQVIIGRTDSSIAPLLPREDSELIAALGLLSRIYEIRGHLEREVIDGTRVPPPFFSREGPPPNAVLKAAEQPAPLKRPTETPFSYLGASVVSTNPELLAWAAAAVISERWLGRLAEQPAPEENLGPPLELANAALNTHIAQLVESVRVIIGDAMRRRGLPPEPEGGFTPQWVVQCLEQQRLDAEWDRQIEQQFGWSWLSKLPIEAWDQALHELDTLNTLFFQDVRGGFLKAFEQQFPAALDEAVNAAANTLCGEEQLGPNASWRPHVLFRRVVAHLLQAFEKDRREDEQACRTEAANIWSDDDLREGPAQISDQLLALKREYRRVPSPLAFWVRVPVFFAIGLALVFWLGLPWLDQVPEEYRLWVQFAGGLVPPAIFSLLLGRRIYRARVRLGEKYEAWSALSREYHRNRLRRDAWLLRQRVWNVAVRYLQWLATPCEAGQRTDLAAFDAASGETTGCPSSILAAFTPETSLHRFIHDYPADLAAGQTASRALAMAVLAHWQDARRLILLPAFPAGEASYARFISWLAEKDVIPAAGSARLSTFTDEVLNVAATDSKCAAILLRHEPLAHSDSTDAGGWNGHAGQVFAVPDAATLSALTPNELAVNPLYPAWRYAVHHAAFVEKVESLVAAWCHETTDPRSPIRDDVRDRLDLCDPPAPAHGRPRRCALVPVDSPLTASLAGDTDRIYTLDSLRYFAFLSITDAVPLAEVEKNFASAFPSATTTTPVATA